MLHYSIGQWFNSGGFPNSAHYFTVWVATPPNASSTRKHHIYGMVCATCTTSYDRITDTASSSSSTYTPTQTNFRAPYTSNPTKATPTPPNTSNTNTAPPPNPPQELHHSLPTPLFCPTWTVWWFLVEKIVKHVEQNTDSTGHPYFSYELLLPSSFTKTV